MKMKTEQEMIAYGEEVARGLDFGDEAATRGAEFANAETGTVAQRANPEKTKMGAVVIELVGDVGTGKTTFTRGLAKGLGAKEVVTSPSFTIMKEYALPEGRNLVHYDFYRLPEPGLMAEDLAEAMADARNVVVIEWGESVRELLPERGIRVKFAYCDDGGREVEILGWGNEEGKK